MIKRVGQCHAILNQSCAFQADIWEHLGEIAMEKICSTDAVQVSRSKTERKSSNSSVGFDGFCQDFSGRRGEGASDLTRKVVFRTRLLELLLSTIFFRWIFSIFLMMDFLKRVCWSRNRLNYFLFWLHKYFDYFQNFIFKYLCLLNYGMFNFVDMFYFILINFIKSGHSKRYILITYLDKYKVLIARVKRIKSFTNALAT